MLEGFNILEYFAVTFVKHLGGGIKCLKLFWIGGEIAFRLWGGFCPSVGFISRSGWLGWRGVNWFGLLGLFGHPFLWCLLLFGGLLPWRRINSGRVAEGARGGGGSLLSRSYRGGWRGGNERLLDRHQFYLVIGDLGVVKQQREGGVWSVGGLG